MLMTLPRSSTSSPQVVRLVLALLKMLPPAKNTPLSVSSFAQAPYWKLLDDENAIQEVFCVAITLLDFLHYHEAVPLDVLEAHLLETKRQLSWALSQGKGSHRLTLFQMMVIY